MEEHSEYGVLRSRDLDELHSLMSIFPRQNGCVECDTNKQLTCPEKCDDGKECVFEVKTDCKSCPQAKCAEVESEGNGGDNNGPPTAAIAGGVIGGVVALIVVTYLLWRFCVKPRRRHIPSTVYETSSEEKTVGDKDFASRRDHRSSTHTVHSVASTVLTRASNIIQIAYIPGVTNRAGPPTSPTVLVPPVPPIPMGADGASTPVSPYEDQHFFMPGDLRDSTYSSISGYTDRTSVARTSYAPRSSIASTIYGKNAIIQAPAQAGVRARPTVVSVRSAASGGSDPETPPVPNIDYDKFGRPKSSLSTFSVGSTFLSNASAATQLRPQVVTVNSGSKKVTVRQEDIDAGNAPPMPDLLTPTEPWSAPDTIMEDPNDQGPFSDPSDRLEVKSARSLSAVIDDATRRAAKAKKSSAERESSPFGDEHATKDQ